MSVVVAILSAPVNLLLDFLFGSILTAPTADSLKASQQESAIMKAARRVSVGIRRASAVGAAVVHRVSNMKRTTSFRDRIPSVIKVKVNRTMVAPSSMVDAQSHARLSVVDMLEENEKQQKEYLEKQQSVRRSSELHHSEEHKKDDHNQQQQEMEAPSFEDFLIDLKHQRSTLPASEHTKFDDYWG